MTKAQPTDQELRMAYKDCQAEYRIARAIEFDSQARLEKIKAQALWRWIQHRKDAAKRGSKL